MAIFGSGKRPPKGDASSKAFRLKMAKYLDGKELRCVSLRDDDGVETIISHGAVFKYDKAHLGILDGEKCIFVCSAADMTAGELLSLEGVLIGAYDITSDKNVNLVAYYKYWRKTEKET